ncbi:cytochrome c [Microaerobacter geothermalis]|uniref:c-type cytochrome n=1 Tax=Microaerobacter geothermalis TaxID=674972 RepID=UPI001F1EAE17|nr:c-type cytochrome [Microaerobacter geothermalis]MCF6092450.1 cytochrome c [Microaerobacter geothermalis]
MGRWLGFFAIGLIVGLVVTVGLGQYIGKDTQTTTQVVNEQPAEKTEPAKEEPAKESATEVAQKATVPEAQIFADKGCTTCHSVNAYGLTGGKQGPDLSGAVEHVESAYGKDLKAFLDKPDSVVMSAVLSSAIQLTEEEKNTIVKLLSEVEK